MRIVSVADYAEMSRRAAELVAQVIAEGPRVLGLPTGQTPVGLYDDLVKRQLDWSQVRAFNLDEYLDLPANHPATFRSFMHRNLFDRGVTPQAWSIPDSQAADPQAECARYEAEIEQAGGLDLVILGLGRNGHIGFNEPGSPFDSRTRVVPLTPDTRQANQRSFPPGEAVPTHAITMGIGTILDAKRVLLLVSGSSKATALAQTITHEPTPEIPGTALQLHPNVTVIADRAALAEYQQE